MGLFSPTEASEEEVDGVEQLLAEHMRGLALQDVAEVLVAHARPAFERDTQEWTAARDHAEQRLLEAAAAVTRELAQAGVAFTVTDQRGDPAAHSVG